MILITTDNSLAFVLKILCFEKLKQTWTLMSMKLAVSIHRTGVTDSNGDWDEDIVIRTGGVGERGQYDRFTVRIHHHN